MKKIGLLFLVISFAVSASAGQRGFHRIFNGKDVSNWDTTGNWFANDKGELEIKPREGEKGWKRFDAYLYSKKKYRNFTIDFEYKYPKGGNSGFFFRIADKKDPVKSGFEVQIKDDHGKKNAGPHDTGGVIQTQGPTKVNAKPAGQWNRMVVTMKDDRLTVKLNGEVVNDFDLKKKAKKPVPDTGYISLQDHGQNLFFRNIKFKELE